MPIIEAGSAVAGQNDGKKENCLILYPEGTSRAIAKAAYFTCDYLITVDEKRNLHLFIVHSEFLL